MLLPILFPSILFSIVLAVHYKLGNYDSNYSTTAKDSYVVPVGKRVEIYKYISIQMLIHKYHTLRIGASRATLSEEVRKDLRAHHFEVNSGANELKTSHYSGFKLF